MKQSNIFLNSRNIWTVAFIIPTLLFLMLSWKNPYGGRSLIGNFDPFPDSMFYVVPARNFAIGQGFKVSRPEGEVAMEVPPLYSVSLIPSYFLNHDARTYYFTNLFLGVISIFLLFKISQRLSGSPFISGLIVLLYAGTYVIYWQTSLSMAENVLIPVLLMSIWLWLQPVNAKNILLTGIFAVACYGSKYVSLPLTVSTLGLYALRISLSHQKILRHLSLLALIATVSLAAMSGSKLLYYAQAFRQAASRDSTAQTATAWISPAFVSKSLPAYAGALMGKPIYNLFSTRPILPPFIGLIVLFWCVYAIYKLPKYRQLSIFILCLTVSQLAFLSLITMIEGRYAFVFLPLMYSGLAAMLGWFIASNKQIAKCIPILTIVTAAIFCLVSLKDWKLQLLLNFKGAEVSWWQVGMVKADEWMRVQPISTKPPILLSVMNPFMWDFYRFGNYQLLPYMQFQDFAERQVWGVTPLPPDWRSFELNEMKTSRDVYISTVGFNPSHWQDFETFQKQHKLTLVNQDCNNSCRLYRIDN